MAKFEVTLRKDGEYQFNLRIDNNEIVLTSEGYTAKSSCMNGIESVRNNSTLDERYDRRVSTNGKPYFVLKAGNGQVIGNSEMYESEKARENGIESVKRNARTATIVDMTM